MPALSLSTAYVLTCYASFFTTAHLHFIFLAHVTTERAFGWSSSNSLWRSIVHLRYSGGVVQKISLHAALFKNRETQDDCDYFRGILLPALKQNLGGRKFGKDWELETFDNTGYVLISTRDIKSTLVMLDKIYLLAAIGLSPCGSFKGKSIPLTGLDRPRGFQEVKVPTFRDKGTGYW